MHEFMWQQTTFRPVGIPAREIVGIPAVLRAAMMFKANSAKLIGQGKQEFVPVKVTTTEECKRLFNQRHMRGNMFWSGFERRRVVSHNVQTDITAQIPATEIGPCKHRRINQGFIVGGGIANSVAAHLRTIERCAALRARLFSDWRARFLAEAMLAKGKAPEDRSRRWRARNG